MHLLILILYCISMTWISSTWSDKQQIIHANILCDSDLEQFTAGIFIDLSNNN